MDGNGPVGVWLHRVPTPQVKRAVPENEYVGRTLNGSLAASNVQANINTFALARNPCHLKTLHILASVSHSCRWVKEARLRRISGGRTTALPLVNAQNMLHTLDPPAIVAGGERGTTMGTYRPVVNNALLFAHSHTRIVVGQEER